MKKKLLPIGTAIVFAPFMLFIMVLFVPFIVFVGALFGLFAGPSIAAKWFTSRQKV